MLPDPLQWLPEAYHGRWLHFEVWCTVRRHRAFPADPAVLLAYLAAYARDSVATLAGRVAVINAAHTPPPELDLTVAAPGGNELVRRAVNPDRARRGAALADRVEWLLPRLSVWGWPHALFHRRAAALLVLASAGLSAREIADLRQRDLRVDGDQIRIGPLPRATITATGDPDRCPAVAVRRWLEIVPLVPHLGGHALLEHHLRRHTLPVIPLRADHAGLPVFTPFDYLGRPPIPLAPLSADSVATLVRLYLGGRIPAHRGLRATPVPESVAPPQPVDIELADTWAAGIAARQRDSTRLADVEELLEGFDDRVAELNARIGHLLDVQE